MELPWLLVYTSTLCCLSDVVMAVAREGGPSLPPSSTSSLVLGVRREGDQHHVFPAVGVEDRWAVDKKRKTDKDEKEKEEAMWLAAMTDTPPEGHNNTEILAQVGGEATFTCYTHHLTDDLVTWLRRDDDQLLTVGQQVYAAEGRFTATYSRQNKAWQLWVKDVQLNDAGHYECQLTTHPPVTFVFTLKVTQAEAVVNGPSEMHIEEGSKLALECEVHRATSPPVYIFWYHNSTMVNYGRQNSLQVEHDNYTSSLVVARVRPSDAGTYTCDPHLATPANITVHVVTGKTPAAMQHGVGKVEGGDAVCCQPAPLTVAGVGLIVCVITNILPTSYLHL